MSHTHLRESSNVGQGTLSWDPPPGGLFFLERLEDQRCWVETWPCGVWIPPAAEEGKDKVATPREKCSQEASNQYLHCRWGGTWSQPLAAGSPARFPLPQKGEGLDAGQMPRMEAAEKIDSCSPGPVRLTSTGHTGTKKAEPRFARPVVQVARNTSTPPHLEGSAHQSSGLASGAHKSD